MLSSPPLVFSFILVSIYAALFHLWWGKSVKELVLYWVAGLVGFGVGQLAGSSLGFKLLMIGQIYVLEGTLACWLFLFIARWLKMSS